MQIRKMKCPACSSALKIHTSHEMSSHLRRAIGQCCNPLCGASYYLYLEIGGVITPPRAPFVDDNMLMVDADALEYAAVTAERLGLSPVSVDDADAALVTLRDELVRCFDYPPPLAETAAAAVLSARMSREVAGKWGLLPLCGTGILVCNDDGQRFAVSLDELVRYVEKTRLNGGVHE